MFKALQDLPTSLRPPESSSVTVLPWLCSCHTSLSVFFFEAHIYFMPFGLIVFSSSYWPSGLWWSRWLDRQTSLTETLLHSPNPICPPRKTVGPCPNTCFTTWHGLFTFLVAVCPLMPQWKLHKVGTFSILSIALPLAPRKMLGIHKLVFIESMHHPPELYA